MRDAVGGVVLDARPLQTAHSRRGVGTYTRMLADLFSYDAAVVWSAGTALQELDGGRVLVTGGPRSGRFGWLRELQATDRALMGMSALVHFTVLEAAAPTRRYVATVHDAIPYRFPSLYPQGAGARGRRALARRLARGAAIVVTPSAASADDAERFLRMPRERITVIPLAPDPGLGRQPAAMEAAALERFGVRRPYILAAGNSPHHDPRKRLEDVVQALAGLPAEVSLVLTGERPDQRIPLDEVIERLQLGSRVFFTGHVTVQELSALFTGAAAFAFPSAWEGFGLPLVNAMHLGVPSVISDGGALPEVAGGAALVHPVGDVAELRRLLLTIIDDPSEAARLGAAGAKRATAFGKSMIAAAYRDLYARAAG